MINMNFWEMGAIMNFITETEGLPMWMHYFPLKETLQRILI